MTKKRSIKKNVKELQNARSRIYHLEQTLNGLTFEHHIRLKELETLKNHRNNFKNSLVIQKVKEMQIDIKFTEMLRIREDLELTLAKQETKFKTIIEYSNKLYTVMKIMYKRKIDFKERWVRSLAKCIQYEKQIQLLEKQVSQYMIDLKASKKACSEQEIEQNLLIENVKIVASRNISIFTSI